MTSGISRRGALAAVFAVTALASRSSFAQTSADMSLARQLGNEGLSLAASGDCAGAIEKLTRAEGLHHAPTTLTVLGECHITVGKLVDGVEELTRVVREDLGARALPAFRKAQVRARQKLEDARPRLPKLRLSVEGARGDASLAIRIDGQTVPSATLGLDRPVDPGPHDLEVSAIGYKTATAHVVMKEGVSQPLKLTLEPLPVSAPVAEPEQATTAPAPARSPRSERRASYLPAGILLGVGAAGVGVGAVLGVLTLNKASHLNSVCQPRSDCPAGEQGDISSANTLALGSTIGFGVGAAAVALGTYFLFKPPKSDGGEAARDFTVRPWMGLASAGLSGSF
jgi:hypothetical protein